MIEITFKINGKKVNPNNIGNAIEASILASIQDSIKKSVGSVCCPTHRKYPKITVKGQNLDNLSLEIKGCCEEITETIKAKLK